MLPFACRSTLWCGVSIGAIRCRAASGGFSAAALRGTACADFRPPARLLLQQHLKSWLGPDPVVQRRVHEVADLHAVARRDQSELDDEVERPGDIYETIAASTLPLVEV